MDYRKLEYFLKVCEAGSISRAAGKLYISQQALSRSIDALEHELGVPLFYRSAQGLTLTRYGEALRQDSTALLAHHNEMLDRLNAMRTEHEQSVSVSFFSGMLRQYPDGFFERFLRRHQDTRFHFYSYADNNHGRKYANMNVDLFFSSDLLSIPGMMLLYEYHRPMCVLLAPDHPLADRERLSLEDLRGEHILTINSDFEAQDRVRERFDRLGIEIDSELSDAEQEFSYSLIRTCRAMMFFAGPQELVPEGTVRIPLNDPSLTWDFYIYAHGGKLPRAARDLVQAITDFREQTREL